MRTSTTTPLPRGLSSAWLLLFACACGGRDAAVQAARPGGHAPAPDEAPPPPASTGSPRPIAKAPTAALDDSPFDARVWVVATSDGGVPAEAVRVDVGVALWEAGTDRRVSDAEVRLGPVDRVIALGPYPADQPWPGVYGGTVTGYERTWAFSITRGADHLSGVIVGPSLPTVSFSATGASGAVGWSPSSEADVVSSACATDESAPPSYVAAPQWCADAKDPGTLILLPSNHVDGTAIAPFPAPDRRYHLVLSRQLERPLGARGSQRVVVSVAMDAPPSP